VLKDTYAGYEVELVGEMSIGDVIVQDVVVPIEQPFWPVIANVVYGGYDEATIAHEVWKCSSACAHVKNRAWGYLGELSKDEAELDRALIDATKGLVFKLAFANPTRRDVQQASSKRLGSF